LDAAIERWVESTIGSGARVVHARRLPGATSAALYRITLLKGVSLTRCVLRLFTNSEWLAVEPDIPEHEAAALQKVYDAGLPVPRLLGCDSRGAACSVPAILMSELPGRVDLLPQNIHGWLRQQAEFLLRLHEVRPDGFAWHYRPYYQPAELAVPSWTSQPQLWEKAIAVVNSPAPAHPRCFIHRDFHPVNMLWRRGSLSGVVDWVNACAGPAGVDVAWNRHNLAAMFGVPMADKFLEVCQDVMGSTWEYQPYWDVQTLLELLTGPIQVYPPWRDFGLTHLTEDLVTKRIEDYLASLLKT
jgi:aminoglycoside phosphotransferase (APT) family kinase protein